MMESTTFHRALDTLEHVADSTPPWTAILASARDVVGADSCSLIMLGRTHNLLLMEQIGMDAATVRDYHEHFHKEDILADASLNSPVGLWWDTVDLIGPPRMSKHPFYADFMHNHRMEQISAFIVLDQPERRAAISFQRSSVSTKPSSAPDQGQRQRFLHAFINAVAAREEAARAEFGTIEGAFAQTQEAHLLVGATGTILRCSSLAFEILSRERLIDVSEMRVVHEKPDAMTGLIRALARAERAPTGVSYALPLSWGRALRFDIVPAAPTLRMSSESVLLVRLREISVFRTPEEEELAAFFSLTGAESRVLRSLVAGHSPAEIAAASGVAERTIRNQIASMMRKMSCTRQSELVRLGTLLL
jgi:DNA-binding CsgD family transcriptional regulator